MTTLKKVSALLLLTLFSVNCYSSFSWSSEGYIDELRIYNGNQVYGKLVGVTLACGTSTFKLASDLKFENAIISMLLSAQTSGKKIILPQETGNCEGTTTFIKGAKLID